MSDRPPTTQPILTDRAKTLKRQFVSFADIRPRLESNCLVQGWLGSGGLSVLYGPSNTGKTFIAIDLAAHVACGADWQGHKTLSGSVIYVACEGGGAIHNRFEAIKKTNSNRSARIDLHLLPTHVDLYESGDAEALCSSMPKAKAALVVIDTMARSMGSGDENSARDVAVFVRNCDVIRERTGAHVLIVHHSGKNAKAGARGSSALRAAVDTEILISGDRISCTKQRDMEIPKTLFFTLQSVSLGSDEGGEEVTSAIVSPLNASTKNTKQPSPRSKTALRALVEVLEASGEVQTDEAIPHNQKVVELPKWRDQCRSRGITDPEASKDTQRKAFDRAKDQLLKLNLIRVTDDFVWMVSDSN